MGFVDYEVDGHVAVITINRPKALNALNEDVLKDIEAAFDAVDLSEIRAIILTGAGEKSFVAGADIAAMSVMTKASTSVNSATIFSARSKPSRFRLSRQ